MKGEETVGSCNELIVWDWSAAFRPHTAKMDAAGERMLNAIAHLIEILEEVRLRLSLEYDVPYRLPRDASRYPDWEDS